MSLVEKIVAETNAYAVKCIQVRPDKVWVPTIENTTWIPKNAIISGKVVGTHTLSGRT